MPDNHGVKLRQAHVADAAALADLHVRAWQWAYQGQMPNDFLVGLGATVASRTAWWEGVLGAQTSDARTWLLEIDEAIGGFASTGPSSDTETAHKTAELYAIYLDQSLVGRGLGLVLLDHALSDLSMRGFQGARLWVLASNERARRFYEVAGWQQEDQTRIEHQPGFDLIEVRYSIALNSAL